MELLRLVASVVLFAFLVAGCDKLFPELAGSTADMALVGDAATDAGSTQLTGKVCLLADLRSPASCLSPAAHRHVTIEENRAAAEVANDGTFTISLVGITDKATFAVTDSIGASSPSTPTISTYSGTMLTLARSQGVGLPVVDAGTMSNMELENGSAGDPAHGAVLTWLIDGKGASVAGASAARITGAIGPLYDAQGSIALSATPASGKFGAVAFLDLVPGDMTLAVSTSDESTVLGDTFKLPIRGGALTVAALQLPSR